MTKTARISVFNEADSVLTRVFSSFAGASGRTYTSPCPFRTPATSPAAATPAGSIPKQRGLLQPELEQTYRKLVFSWSMRGFVNISF